MGQGDLDQETTQRLSLTARVRQIVQPSREGMAARSLAESSAHVFLGNVLFVILGTAQVMVVGAVFGTSREYELFLLAWMVPELCLFGLGNVLSMHLIPVLLEIRSRQGERELREAGRAVSTHLSLLLIVACGVAYLTAPALLDLVTGEVSGAELEATVAMFRALLVPAFGFALVKHFGLLHRASHSLGLPALVQALSPLAVIALVFLAPQWGVRALVVAYGCGALAQLLLLLPAPLSWGTFGARSGLHPAVTSLFASAAPLLVITSGFRLMLLLDRVSAASLAPGDVAVLRYALFFLMGVQSLLAMPLISVGFNRLSHLASTDDRSAGGGGAVERTTLLMVEALWCLVLPLACVLVAVPDDLVQLVLGRRAFGPEAIARTGAALALYAAMLPFLAGYMVAEKAFLSRREYRYLLACALVFPLLNLALNEVLGRRLGVSGVALATTVAMALWFLALLCRLLGRAPVAERVQLARSLLTTTAIAVVTLVTVRGLGAGLALGWLARLAVMAGATLALYAALAWLVQRRRLAVLYRTLTETRVGM